MSGLRKPKKLCIFCVHFNELKSSDEIPTCKAFPDKIPDEIFLEWFDHRYPFPNDNGIQFEKFSDLTDLSSIIKKFWTLEAINYIFELSIQFYDEYEKSDKQADLNAKRNIIMYAKKPRSLVENTAFYWRRLS